MTTPVDDDVVRTIRARVVAEPTPIRGSRFRATIAPVTEEDQARAVVATVSRGDADASHHCWAVRLASGTARSNDDGEPNGTAGPPILRHLAGADLADVVCVVTRWFGGTKLGTGGLVRAYGGAAAAAIEAATIVERPRLVPFELVHPWDLTAPVDAVLAAHDARQVSADYGLEVALVVAVPASRAHGFPRAVADATSGRVVAAPA